MELVFPPGMMLAARGRNALLAKGAKVRFCVGRDGALSEVWTVLGRKTDVYVMSQSMRGRIKLSCHGSGVCQLAFAPPYADEIVSDNQLKFKDRTIQRWKRPPTPPNLPVHLTSIYLSAFGGWETEENIKLARSTVMLPPPDHGSAIEVAVFLSNSSPLERCAPYEPEEIILSYFQLTSGEFVTLLPRLLPLTPDYFDFRKLDWFMAVGHQSETDFEDARGISSISFIARQDGGVDFHSRHNMRLLTVPADFDPSTLNPA